MNAARSMHERLWARFQQQATQSVPNVPYARETERPLSTSLPNNTPAPESLSRARDTVGTVDLLADGMCEHISPENRANPANVGSKVRCAACWLVAHPDWRPRRLARLFASIADLKKYAATAALTRPPESDALHVDGAA